MKKAVMRHKSFWILQMIWWPFLNSFLILMIQTCFWAGFYDFLWHSSTEICWLLKKHCLWFNHLQTKATRPWWHPVLSLFGWLGCGCPGTYHTSLPSHASAHCWWEVPTKGLCVSTTEAETWWLFSLFWRYWRQICLKELLIVVSVNS